jgi:2-dehydro-3-deoxygalactonokinase
MPTVNAHSNGPPLIIGDWGSTQLRLRLCSIDGKRVTVKAQKNGPGVKDVVDPELVLRQLAGGWLEAYGNLPIALSGMIGSTLGWRETGYVPCPARLDHLAQHALHFKASELDITIAPGLSCISPVEHPDIMRGEEVQIFGWLASQPDDDTIRLLCLPGTHTKWVRTVGREVHHFITSMQGEIFQLLLSHGLLGRSLDHAWDPASDIDSKAFQDGVMLIAENESLALQHAVFTMRSHIVSRTLNSAAAPSFLSGVAIAAELRDGMRLMGNSGRQAAALVLIGGANLVALYAKAAALLNLEVEQAVDEELSIYAVSNMVRLFAS